MHLITFLETLLSLPSEEVIDRDQIKSPSVRSTSWEWQENNKSQTVKLEIQQ